MSDHETTLRSAFRNERANVMASAKKVGYSTFMYYPNENTKAIRHHKTDILHISEDEFTIYVGISSRTTIKKINEWLPHGIIRQVQGDLYYESNNVMIKIGSFNVHIPTNPNEYVSKVLSNSIKGGTYCSKIHKTRK